MCQREILADFNPIASWNYGLARALAAYGKSTRRGELAAAGAAMRGVGTHWKIRQIPSNVWQRSAPPVRARRG